MTFKEFLLLHLQLFCVLVTLIYAASLIVGMIAVPQQSLQYYQLVGPFILAALCVLPTFITYFRKEPTLGQYIFRHILQLALIEAIVLVFTEPPAGTGKVLFYVIIGVIVLVIYAIAKLMVWLQKYMQSKKLTEQLKQLQREGETE